MGRYVISISGVQSFIICCILFFTFGVLGVFDSGVSKVAEGEANISSRTIRDSVFGDCDFDICVNIPENANGTSWGNNDPNDAGLIWCEVDLNPAMPNERVCLHELGHFVDDSLGWVSKSGEWKDMVDTLHDLYLEGDFEEIYEPMLRHIDSFAGIGENPLYEGWGGYTELYADIYGYWMAGVFEIPDEMQRMFGR